MNMGRKVKSKAPDKSMEQEVTGVVICFFSLFLLIGVYVRGCMGSFGNLVILYFDSRDLNFSLIMKIIHINCGTFRKYKKKFKKNTLKKNKEEKLFLRYCKSNFFCKS